MSFFLIRSHCSRHAVFVIPYPRTHSLFTTTGAHDHKNATWLSPRFRSSTAFAPFSLPPQHQIYISQSIDPYFNLTFEDWYVERRATLDPVFSDGGAVQFPDT